MVPIPSFPRQSTTADEKKQKVYVKKDQKQVCVSTSTSPI